MKKTAALALAIVVAVAAPAFAGSPSAPDRAFRAQVEQFVQAELQLYPERATHLGDHRFDKNLQNGFGYWKKTFFLEDGTPRYYDRKTLPIDIQCSSQAIDTLVFLHDQDPENLPLALRVALWTIENMQDRTGYFYYRRYSNWLVNKAPTLHWGQATMLCALAGLYKLL